MAVNAAWPPLTALSMFVIIVAFIIIKYGDKLFGARSVPLRHEDRDDDERSSVDTVSCRFLNEKDVEKDIETLEGGSLQAYPIPSMSIIDPDPPRMQMDHPRIEKYEYAV